MPKPKLSKVVKEEVKEPTFKVTLKMNDQVFEAETNDIVSFVTSLKPTFLKTKVIISVEKNSKKAERMLLGFRARQFFRNPLFLRTFLSKLTYK